mgnify:CR=1 FL=1
MNLLITYFFLFLAVFFGTASNFFAKNSDGFIKILPASFSAITIILCMFCLSHVMKVLSAGMTYATFAGMCIISTTFIDVIKFNQWPNFYSFLGLLLIIIGVLLVNLISQN